MEIGEGGYHGETYGVELEDLAYKGLGGIVPPHSRAFITTPSACYALRVLTGVVTIFLFFFLSETGPSGHIIKLLIGRNSWRRSTVANEHPTFGLSGSRRGGTPYHGIISSSANTLPSTSLHHAL